MKTLCLSAVLALALSGCGSIIKAPVSRDELAKVHKVGVATAFDNQFYGRQLGWTVFGNQKFEADVSLWDVNKLAQARAIEALRQGNPKLQVAALTVPQLSTLQADKELSWLNSAQQQGIDTIVLVRPGVSDNYPFFAPGVGIFARHSFTCVYTAYVVEVYDVAARKQIAWEWGASPPCNMGVADAGVQFKADAGQYSAAEMEAMRALVDSKFAKTLPVAMEGLHLTGGKL